MDYLNERQGLILKFLRERGAVSVREVQEHLGISSATIYRDIAALVRTDMVHRHHGRLIFRHSVSAPSPKNGCVMCGGGVDPRTAISIQMDDGRQLMACCPHCGVMYISRQPGVASALATDFLYGKMHNLGQAIYLLESQVQICCAPSLLCFATPEEAGKFQAGFGGRVVSFEQAVQALQHMMALYRGGHRPESD